MNGAGQIDMVPYGLMPEHLRPAVVHNIDDVVLSGVPRAPKKRMEGRYGMVQSYLTLHERKVFKIKDVEINAAMDAIREEATAYLAMTLPDPEYDLKVQRWQAGEGPKPRSKSTVEIPDAVSARTLRKWVTAFKKGGKRASERDLPLSMTDMLPGVRVVARRRHLVGFINGSSSAVSLSRVGTFATPSEILSSIIFHLRQVQTFLESP